METMTAPLPSRYKLNSAVVGDQLVLAISSIEPCRDHTVETVEVTEVVERTLPNWHWALLGSGVAAFAAGIVMTAVGLSAPTSSPTGVLPSADEAADRDTRTVLLPIGIAAEAVGGGAMLWDFIQLTRTGTDERIRSTTRVHDKPERVCSEKPLVSAEVVLTDTAGTRLIAATDRSGRANFPLVRIADFVNDWLERGGQPEPVRVSIAGQTSDVLELATIEPIANLLTAKKEDRKRKLETTAAEESERRKRARDDVYRLSTQETKTMRCLPERNAKMQQILSFLKSRMGTDGANLTYLGHAITPAGAAGPGWLARAGLAGSYHVFGVSFQPLTAFEVRGADDQLAVLTSPFVELTAGIGEGLVQSRVLQANTAERYTVKAAGAGCTLIVVFHEQ